MQDEQVNQFQSEVVPEGVIPASGWPDFRSYANVKMNKSHNGLFCIQGTLYAIFKRVRNNQQLWEQDKNMQQQIAFKQVTVGRQKLKDKPFYYKKKKKRPVYYDWHLYQWDQRQGWQHVVELEQFGEDGGLVNRRFPPSIVHVQEVNKQDERMRLLVSHGDGVLRYVEQLDDEETQQQQKIRDLEMLELGDLCFQIDSKIKLAEGLTGCLTSDPVCVLQACPPLRGVRPFSIQSAILHNDSQTLYCVLSSMNNDVKKGFQAYFAEFKLVQQPQHSWGEDFVLQLKQIKLICSSDILPYMLAITKNNTAVNNSISNNENKCNNNGNYDDTGFSNISDSEVVIIQQLKNVDVLIGKQTCEYDEKDYDVNEGEELDVESENEGEEKKQQHWTDFFPGCVESFGANPLLGGLQIKKIRIKENGEVSEDSVCYSNESVQFVAVNKNCCIERTQCQILVYDAQGDFQILQFNSQDPQNISLLAKFQGLYKHLNKDIENVMFYAKRSVQIPNNSNNNDADTIDSNNDNLNINNHNNNNNCNNNADIICSKIDVDDTSTSTTPCNSNNVDINTSYCKNSTNINDGKTSNNNNYNSDGRIEAFVVILVSCDGKIRKIEYSKLQQSIQTQCWQILNQQQQGEHQQETQQQTEMINSKQSVQEQKQQNRKRNPKGGNVWEGIIGVEFYGIDDVQAMVLTNKKMVRIK